MSNQFAWNDAIEHLNKINSLKSLMFKLYPMWAKEGRVQACIMYSACNSVGFSDFRTLEQLKHYIETIHIDMIYIKTSYGEWQVYLDKYDTYRFEDRKDYKLLKIIRFDKEIDIKI